jgi:hypothetical protein
MTRYETTSLVMSLLGLTAVVASIWFLRGQVRLMSEQTRRLNDTLQMSAESALDSLFVFITQAYMDHPNLRPVFNEGESHLRFEDLSQDDQLRANALAESLLDAMERAIRFREEGLSSSGPLHRWIEDSLRDSTFLRTWLREHATWYLPELSALFRDEPTAPPQLGRPGSLCG